MNDITQTMPVSPPAEERTLLGHPRGLLVLFLTEMWERFSYYGMRALLIIYLTQHFLFSDEQSNLIYGAYIALVYVMTIVGGTLADRYLGSRKAATFGAILLVLGHFGMAFEGEGSRELIEIGGAEYDIILDGRGGDAKPLIKSADGTTSPVRFGDSGRSLIIENAVAMDVPPSVDLASAPRRIVREEFYVNALYLSLALIIAGIGFLKANISTIVGSLYGQQDPRRDSGFTIFYMGINLGSLLATSTCTLLAYAWGWKWGFGLAGLGMLLGLTIFLSFQGWLEGKAEPPNPALLKKKLFAFVNVEAACYLCGLVIVGLALIFVKNPAALGGVMTWIGPVVFALLVGYAVTQCAPKERDRMLAAIYFMLAQIPFWALFEQAGSSLNLFTDRLVDRSFFGWNVPGPVFQGLNAGFIVLFAPLAAWLWVTLDKRNWNPSAPVKFALGVALAGLGFLALVAGMTGSGTVGLTPVIFIFLIYWIHTMGELMVSPVGLSMVTKLAPVQVVGMAMGAWFLYSGMSNYLSGVIAQTTGAETIGGKLIDVAAAKAGYIEVYSNVGYVALAVALVMLLIAPVINKLMHGAE